MDLYSEAELDKATYLQRNLEMEEIIKQLSGEKQEMSKTLFILDNQPIIENSIEEYSKKTKANYRKCADFLSKRKFIMEACPKNNTR